MKKSRKRIKPWTVRTAGNYAGRPRVVNDCEAYTVVSQIADDSGPGDRNTVKELAEYIRLWCTPYEDWQIQVMAQRAHLFLACLRKELGRRMNLDPSQLALEGM
jgi:hypothetical protein